MFDLPALGLERPHLAVKLAIVRPSRMRVARLFAEVLSAIAKHLEEKIFAGPLNSGWPVFDVLETYPAGGKA